MAFLPILAAGAAIAGGVVGAAGAMHTAKAQEAAGNYNAQIADYNASVADRNRRALLQSTALEVDEKRRESARTLSTIRAAYGASGLALEGSPLDVLEDTASELELDALKIGYSGELKALGMQDEARNYQMKASLSRMEATSARQAGPINATSALLGGLSRAGSAMQPARV